MTMRITKPTRRKRRRTKISVKTMKVSLHLIDEVESHNHSHLALLTDAPPVSLDDALSKPIYSLDANTSDASEEEGDKGEGPSGPKRKLQACILCPQKLFKNEKMAEDHLKSKVSRVSLWVKKAC